MLRREIRGQLWRGERRTETGPRWKEEDAARRVFTSPVEGPGETRRGSLPIGPSSRADPLINHRRFLPSAVRSDSLVALSATSLTVGKFEPPHRVCRFTRH